MRDEKHEATKMLHDIEFIIGNKDKEIEVLQDEKSTLIKSHNSEVKEFEDRLAFFRDNQKLLTEGEDENRSQFKEVQDLKQ